MGGGGVKQNPVGWGYRACREGSDETGGRVKNSSDSGSIFRVTRAVSPLFISVPPPPNPLAKKKRAYLPLLL
jgi:hypothetical protein